MTLRLVNSILLLVLSLSVFAQEELVPLTYNQKLMGTKFVSGSNRAVGDTLTLPIVDDFSGNSIYPSSIWMDSIPVDTVVYHTVAIGVNSITNQTEHIDTIVKDKYGRDSINTYYRLGYDVFISRNYPKSPVSVGVMTFDGLAGNGLPYTEIYDLEEVTGVADVVRSKPIDLSMFDIDTGLIFSFYVQQQGFGDAPNDGDSLILQFKDENDEWINVWAANGGGAVPTENFDSLVILDFFNVTADLDSANYARKFLHEGFQFQFKNIANRAGANDHWHIDFLRFYHNGSAEETYFFDVSYVNLPNTILDINNYTSIPGSHLQESYLIDDYNFNIYNFMYNDPLGQNNAFNKLLKVLDRHEGDTLYFGDTSSSEVSGITEQYITDNMKMGDAMDAVGNFLSGQDSVGLEFNFMVESSNGRDFIEDNNVVKKDFNFYNYYAYDDGSAEQGYGINAVETGARIAMEFEMLKADSLRGAFIHFIQKNIDQSNEEFQIAYWPNGINDDSIVLSKVVTPNYIDSINGWAYYAFEEPIYVKADTFYMGWVQTTTEKLNIGFDVNDTAKTVPLSYNTSNYWVPSKLKGAVMYRPVIGNPFVYTIGIEEQFEETSMKLYPNPADQMIQVELNNNGEVQVFNLSGQLMTSFSTLSSISISTSSWNNGIYIVRFIDDLGNTSTQRFIIQH